MGRFIPSSLQGEMMKSRYGTLRFLFILALLAFCVTLAPLGCDDDDDDNDDHGATPGDDDDDDDDAQPDIVPTTLDLTLIPVLENGEWTIGYGQGESHVARNDLKVAPGIITYGEKKPLSMAYFITMSDLHQTDEESPTRLTFFDSISILFGAFSAAFRPQEDVGPHQLNALVRTANRIQEDYGRDFDFALMLGDATDNSQYNEYSLLLDILDGTGLTSGIPGIARPDSGDLALDEESGLNTGERHFGLQEVDAQGNNINAFTRPDYPNSNADFAVSGLRRADGTSLPWFAVVGNHDALNTGNFDPDTFLTFYSTEDYVGSVSPFGFIPGLANTVQYCEENPDQALYLDGGLFGLNIDWSWIFDIFKFVGLIPDDYSADLDDRFDLMTLTHGTLTTGIDDGVTIAADPKRAFLGRDGTVQLAHSAGHGFADNNHDGQVDGRDGGFYVLDMDDIEPGSVMPLRLLMLDTTDNGFVSEGGLSDIQLTWLRNQLIRAVEDKKLVILASHHQEGSISNSDKLQNMLHACPNVILHLVGHGHDNVITPHPAPDGDPLHGYWEVETPSGIAFPQQMRIIELVDQRDGTGLIYLTLFDHWPLVGDDADILAELGRTLAFGDKLHDGFDGGTLESMGWPSDRNRALMFAIPADIVAVLDRIETDDPVSSTDVLGQRWNPSAKSKTLPVVDSEPSFPRAKPYTVKSLIEDLQKAVEDPALAEKTALDPEAKKQLKNLGYLF